MWKWVWVYAIPVIVLGQIAWNFGLKHARAGDVSLATSFSPLAAILIAMTLLGEDPGPGLIPGAILILIAIVIGNLGRSPREPVTDQPRTRNAAVRPRWETPEWAHTHGPERPLTCAAALAVPPDGKHQGAQDRAGSYLAASLRRWRPPPVWHDNGSGSGVRRGRLRPPSARLSSGPRSQAG